MPIIALAMHKMGSVRRAVLLVSMECFATTVVVPLARMTVAKIVKVHTVSVYNQKDFALEDAVLDGLEKNAD